MKLEKLEFDENGLVPAVIQDQDSGAVLMVGYMNSESLAKTLDSKKVHFYSRSRQKLWLKGESSGNLLIVSKILADCDGDTLLISVNPTGPICHTGQVSCFDNYEPLEAN